MTYTACRVSLLEGFGGYGGGEGQNLLTGSWDIGVHGLAVLGSDMEDGWFTVRWEKGPCCRGFILEEGKTRARLRPSINLITCELSLATGEKKKKNIRLREILFNQAGGVEGTHLLFPRASFFSPAKLEWGPVSTTVPPCRLVLVFEWD